VKTLVIQTARAVDRKLIAEASPKQRGLFSTLATPNESLPDLIRQSSLLTT
jgi:hypothetical protein